MRIAIAHYYWDYPESEYGLPTALVGRGNQVILTVWKGNSQDAKSYSVNGFRVFMLPGVDMGSPLARLNIKNPYVSGISRLYDGFAPDIVDCQSHLFLTTMESLRAAKKRKIPSVVTVRGVMAKRDFVVNSAQQVYLYTMASKAFKDATLVRCLTGSDAREVERYGCSPGKIRVIPNFVDTDAFKPDGATGEKILWYGRFVEEKGVRFLVEAASRLLRADGRADFVLAGDGPQRDSICMMVEGLGIRERFSIPGKVDRRELIGFLKESSIVVIPSIKEGMPFSLLEAMSSGKAVVASDIPGIRDLVRDGENGLLVPPADPVALAGALEALRRDPSLREKLGAAARKTVMEGYSERVVVDRIEAMYREAGA